MKLSIYNLTLNKKTLIFFLPNFSQGGAGETLSKLMMYLAKKHDCFLICLNNCFYKKILIKNKVKIIEINSNKTFFSMFKIRNIVKKILNAKENAIFISNINYANVLSIIFLRSLNNLKIILYEKTPIQELETDYGNFKRKIKNKIIKKLIKYTYIHANKIITNSKVTSLDFKRYLNKDVKTIYSKSIDKIKKFRKIKVKNIKILWIGRFSNEKSFDTLIDAVNILKNLDIKIFVLGDGAKKKIYFDKIQQLRISHKFKFFGYKKNLDNYFKSSNLYISTSYYEGFPNSVIQAINYSLPIVASKSYGGINEIIKNKHSGVFFKVDDPLDLSQKIIEYKKNKLLFQKYAFSALKDLEKFDFKNIEKKFENEILKV